MNYKIKDCAQTAAGIFAFEKPGKMMKTMGGIRRDIGRYTRRA